MKHTKNKHEELDASEIMSKVPKQRISSDAMTASIEENVRLSDLGSSSEDESDLEV